MSTTAESAKKIQIPICSSCNRTIPSSTRAIKFACPNCGEIIIWRCQKCRKFGREYKCPKCGFRGP